MEAPFLRFAAAEASDAVVYDIPNRINVWPPSPFRVDNDWQGARVGSITAVVRLVTVARKGVTRRGSRNATLGFFSLAHAALQVS